jgi:hypothetical protein
MFKGVSRCIPAVLFFYFFSFLPSKIFLFQFMVGSLRLSGIGSLKAMGDKFLVSVFAHIILKLDNGYLGQGHMIIYRSNLIDSSISALLGDVIKTR